MSVAIIKRKKSIHLLLVMALLSVLSVISYANVTPEVTNQTLNVGDTFPWLLTADFFDPMYSKKTKYDPPKVLQGDENNVTISPSSSQSGITSDYDVTPLEPGSYQICVSWLNTQFDLSGQSILNLNVTQPPVTFDGFIHDITTNASVIISGNQLCINRNPGSTDPFGADITIPPSTATSPVNPDNRAFGYIPVDNENDCSGTLPTQGTTLESVQARGSVNGSPNQLWGDWFIVADNDFTQGGDNLVHIEADPAVGTDTGYTFYGRYTTNDVPNPAPGNFPAFPDGTPRETRVGTDDGGRLFVEALFPNPQTLKCGADTFTDIDRVRIWTTPTSTITDLSQVQIRSHCGDTYYIASETLSATDILNGLRHRSLVDATFYVEPGSGRVVINAPNASPGSGISLETGRLAGGIANDNLLDDFDPLSPPSAGSEILRYDYTFGDFAFALGNQSDSDPFEPAGEVEALLDMFDDDEVGFNIFNDELGNMSFPFTIFNGDSQVAAGTATSATHTRIDSDAFDDNFKIDACIVADEVTGDPMFRVELHLPNGPADITPPGAGTPVQGDTVCLDAKLEDLIEGDSPVGELLGAFVKKVDVTSDTQETFSLGQPELKQRGNDLRLRTDDDFLLPSDDEKISLNHDPLSSNNDALALEFIDFREINGGLPTGSLLIDDIEFATPGDRLDFSATGTLNASPNSELGRGSIENDSGDINFFGDFPNNPGNDIIINSYHDNMLIGATTVPGGSGNSLGIFPPGTTIIGLSDFDVDAPSGDRLGFFTDDVVTFTANNTTPLMGNEFRIQPVITTTGITARDTLNIQTQGGIDQIGILEATVTDQDLLPMISDVSPLTGGEDEFIEITGSNFGTNVHNICALIMDEDNNRSVPLNVINVNGTGTSIMTQLGPVPYDVGSTGTVMVGLGSGTFQEITGVDGVVDEGLTWVWEKFPRLNNPDASFGANFILIPNIDPDDPNMPPPDPNMPPPDPNECKLFSGGVTGGELCIDVDCEWPEDAKVKIFGRIRDNRRNKGLDTFSACTVFEGGPFSAFECAQKICEFLKASWLAQAKFTINCVVTDNGDDTAKITISFPAPCQIDWGNLTICASPSPKTQKNANNKKVSVKVDKDRTDPKDALAYQGTFTGTLDEFTDADDIIVSVCDGDGEVFSETIVIDQDDLNGSKYSYKAAVGVAALTLDFDNGDISVSLKDVSLSGLDAPLSVKIEYDNVVLTGAIPASAFKKPLSVCLQTGIEDTLTITKVNFKFNSKKGLSSLAVQGGIAAEDPVDFTLEDVTVVWGDNFQEILIDGSFTSKKPGVFTYKRPKNGPGDITGITIDLNKCTYKLDIKNTDEILDSIGTVEMEIFSDGFESGDTTSWTFD